MIGRKYIVSKQPNHKAGFSAFNTNRILPLVAFVCCLLVCFQSVAQSEYQIRLVAESPSSVGEICYQVALSSTTESWYLAGQNYRLFYDASVLQFQSGSSLLSSSYQNFTLVQNVTNLDASTQEGCLHYAATLGFLNYSIDLLDVSEPSMAVPSGEDWLPTTQLCFQLVEGTEKVPTITLGRSALTIGYAPSYVEISEYKEGQTTSAKGMEYLDIGNPCEYVMVEEEELEMEVEVGVELEDASAIQVEIGLHQDKEYDIRITPSNKETENSICYEVALRSALASTWKLAGQNYRLYYDASQIEFLEGTSFLEAQYEDFRLIENIDGADASGAAGCLSFAADLGFLNYSIDLVDNTVGGQVLPIEAEWLLTSELCFSKKTAFVQPSLIWARDALTQGYATSFVEISEWVETDNVVAAMANNYQDIGTACESQEVKSVLVNLKAFLQGPFDPKEGWMKDDLRTNNYLPRKDPNPSHVYEEERDSILFRNLEGGVLSVEGEKAVVDWISLELRDAVDPSKIVAKRSALLLRNGQIVELDGEKMVQMSVPPQSYYIALRHRNHLGIMTAEPIELTTDQQTTTEVDFTKSTTKTYGMHSRKVEGEWMCLWAGNSDTNRYLVLEGSGIALPDTDKIFFDIFLHEANEKYNYNFIARGYYDSDVNMDGEVHYQGLYNERDVIFFNIIEHPNNPNFHSNFFIEEQLPD